MIWKGFKGDNAYQSKNQAMRLKKLLAGLRDMIALRHTSAEGYKNNYVALNVPKSTVA